MGFPQAGLVARKSLSNHLLWLLFLLIPHYCSYYDYYSSSRLVMINTTAAEIAAIIMDSLYNNSSTTTVDHTLRPAGIFRKPMRAMEVEVARWGLQTHEASRLQPRVRRNSLMHLNQADTYRCKEYTNLLKVSSASRPRHSERRSDDD